MIQRIIHLKKGNRYQTGFYEMFENNSYRLRFSFVLKILALAFILSACQNNTPQPRGADTTSIPRLIYTKHARCRMECRHINEAEIKEILAENNINGRKSNPDGKPCPSYAYEGYSNDHQHLRIVIGKCDDRAWKVITCIDLGNEFECDCH